MPSSKHGRDALLRVPNQTNTSGSLVNALFPMHTTITALRDPLYHFLHELWSQVDDSGYGCPHLALDDFELQLVNGLLSSPRPLTPAQREEVTKLQTRCEPHLHCQCTNMVGTSSTLVPNQNL